MAAVNWNLLWSPVLVFASGLGEARFRVCAAEQGKRIFTYWTEGDSTKHRLTTDAEMVIHVLPNIY